MVTSPPHPDVVQAHQGQRGGQRGDGCGPASWVWGQVLWQHCAQQIQGGKCLEVFDETNAKEVLMDERQWNLLNC